MWEEYRKRTRRREAVHRLEDRSGSSSWKVACGGTRAKVDVRPLVRGGCARYSALEAMRLKRCVANKGGTTVRSSFKKKDGRIFYVDAAWQEGEVIFHA